MNPSDAGSNDRFVVQEVIKEIAQSGSVLAKTGAQKKGPAFKVILMVEVDRLSRQAQAGLRRTMEKSSSACRLVMICTNPSKVIDPIRSRCLGIRIAAPCVSVSLVFSTRYAVDAATARASYAVDATPPAQVRGGDRGRITRGLREGAPHVTG